MWFMENDPKFLQIVFVQHRKGELYLLYNYKLLVMVKRLLPNLFPHIFKSLMFIHLLDRCPVCIGKQDDQWVGYHNELDERWWNLSCQLRASKGTFRGLNKDMARSFSRKRICCTINCSFSPKVVFLVQKPIS